MLGEFFDELRSFLDATALGGCTAQLAQDLEGLHILIMQVHGRIDVETDYYAGWLTTSDPPPT